VKHFVISEDELEEIFHKGRPRSEKAWNDMLSIRAKIMQRSFPEDAVGWAFCSRTDSTKYEITLIPKDWLK
jgi:hypothetical protein